MSMADRIPGMSDQGLKTLHANAERLQRDGKPGPQAAANELLPLITAEMAQREAAKPVPAKKKPDQRVAKTATKTAAKTKAKA